MKITHRKIVSAVVALLIPSGKMVQALAGEVAPKQQGHEETKSQFKKSDCIGKFKKTHENCLPVQQDGKEQIEIHQTGEAVLSHSKSPLCRFEWNGFEGRSSTINQDVLHEYGVNGCKSIYCRPVNVPGGTALWISFLPNKDSQDSILDLLFSKEEWS